MKLIIAGSRSIRSYRVLLDAIDALLDEWGPIYGPEFITEVVSGHASSGVDLLGEVWAKRNGVPCRVFPANWNVHGRKAGYVRNVEMADYVGLGTNGGLLAIHDGKSPGTKMMIGIMERRMAPVYVYLAKATVVAPRQPSKGIIKVMYEDL